jgi:hypothetical protein
VITPTYFGSKDKYQLKNCFIKNVINIGNKPEGGNTFYHLSAFPNNNEWDLLGIDINTSEIVAISTDSDIEDLLKDFHQENPLFIDFEKMYFSGYVDGIYVNLDNISPKYLKTTFTNWKNKSLILFRTDPIEQVYLIKDKAITEDNDYPTSKTLEKLIDRLQNKYSQTILNIISRMGHNRSEEDIFAFENFLSLTLLNNSKYLIKILKEEHVPINNENLRRLAQTIATNLFHSTKCNIKQESKILKK